MTENILEYQEVGKSFHGVPVLRQVSFALPKGSVLGLVGENGAGKSTLMNILGGVTPADAGRILLGGHPYVPRSPVDARACGIAFIHQELNLFTNLSVAENIFISGFPQKAFLIDKRVVRRKAAQLLEAVGLHISPDTLVENLSQGERQLVEIAKALSVKANIIIFDEPTTSLSRRETERLFEIIRRLRTEGISMIYISHALEHVREVCDRIVVLRDGTVVGAGLQIDFDTQRMVRLMVGRSLDQLYPERGGRPSAEKRIEVRGLSQTGIVRDINLIVHKSEILGVSGLMGSGRSELARILFGLDPYEQGDIFFCDAPLNPSPRECIRRGLAFLTENRREEGLLMQASIEDNIELVALPSFARSGSTLIEQGRVQSEVMQAASAVRLDERATLKQMVSTLSGGNQQKVVLAKWLLKKPAAFIMDEPTRGIDVGAKYEIYRLINQLADGGAGVLVISSEIEELIGICDRILVMKAGEIQACFRRDEFDREKILRAAISPGEKQAA